MTIAMTGAIGGVVFPAGIGIAMINGCNPGEVGARAHTDTIFTQ